MEYGDERWKRMGRKKEEGNVGESEVVNDEKED